MRCLQFRHDCQNLGCANLSCTLCKLSQRRRCDGNFAPKYLAPCDVIEAKCGAQIYTVVVETDTGELVSQGLDDALLQMSIIDGRRFEHEGERDDVLDACQLLTNKQGGPLLAHGRSGAYSDDKRVLVPMIHGQAMLPDLKVTDSSEALLQGRAPPFRLLVRAVRRSGQPIPEIRYALSEPFVVATARVKGAAKLEIPHVDDHVSKIECVGVQTQKKLEDITAASAVAGVPDLRIPINCVTKVGQFRDLVELAERNKPLRETLKQVLRLTKGWDVARDHVRRAVETDVQLRVYHPDGRTDVGLVFKCGAFNVVEMHRPVGLLRRKSNPQQPNQELVDIIWLPLDVAAHPDAVKKLLPQANNAWWTDGHPGWQFLPLTVAHLPAYGEGGQPASLTSSFTFTMRPAAAVQGAAAAMPGIGLPAGVPQGLAGTGGLGSAGSLPLPTGPPSSSAFSAASAAGMAGLPGLPLAGGLPSAVPGALPGLLPLQGMPALGAAGAAAPALFGAAADPGLQPLLGFGGGALLPASMALPALQPAASASGMSAEASMAAAGSDPGLGPQPDSLSPFEDPSFQQLMSAVAANGAASAPASEGAAPAARPSAPTSGYGAGGRGSPPGSSDSGQVKRKADTSLETWIAAHKSLDFDFSLPPNLAQLSSLFTSLMMGGDMGGAAALSVPEQKQARREGPSGSGGLAGLVGLAGLGAGGPPGAAALPAGSAAAVAAPVLTQQLQSLQQPLQQPLQQQPLQQQQQQQQVQQQQVPAPLPQPAQQAPAPSQPASLIGVSMEEMQGMFAKAARQEISYAELEAFLKEHNLLPPGEGGGGGAAASQPGGKQEQQQQLPAQAAPAAEGGQSESMGMEPSFEPNIAARGLEDMKSIEMAMPAISSGGQEPQ